MANKIFNIQFENSPIKVDEKFNEVYNDSDNAFFVSKNVFTHEDDGLTFDYQYAIEGIWCDGKIFYSLMLVPCPKSLTRNKLQSVADFCGVDSEDVTIYDICTYGCYVIMDNECIECNEIEDKYFDLIASVLSTIDRLHDFYLDKCINRIGNTGWDMLYDYVKGVNFLSKLAV